MWHHLRTTLTPELTSNKTMKEFLPELMMVTEDFIKLIDVSRNSQNVVRNFEQLCNRLGLESKWPSEEWMGPKFATDRAIFKKILFYSGTCTLILGKRFHFLQDTHVDPMGQTLADAISGQFCASRDTFYGLPLWKVFSTPAYKNFIRCEDTIYE